MKTLSAFNQTVTDKPYVDLIRLVQIDFSGLSLYLCDRVFGDPGSEFIFNSQLYEPLVLEWGTLRHGRIDPVTWKVEPGEFEFVLDNTLPVGGAARLTALFADYDPHFALVTYSEIFAGAAAAGDRIDQFVGTIEDLGDLTASRLTVYCSGLDLDIVRKFSHTILNTDDYGGADPDDVGKMLPQIGGAPRKVPCLAVDAGALSTIAQEMSADEPGNGETLEISNAAFFPSSGVFTVQIDDEQIRIASRSGNVMTLAASGARGYNDTSAAIHDAGSDVAEIQTEYIYLAADHPVYSIDAVYVDNVRQDQSVYDAYSGYVVDSYTKLLLHMNGDDTATTFTDDGATGHTVTANGDAQLDTAQKKFGTASGLFDGTGDYLSLADHADWNFADGKLTIDFWVRFNSLPASSAYQYLFAQYVDGTHRAVIGLYNDGSDYYLLLEVYDGSQLIDLSDVWSVSVDTWYHIACIRGWGGNANDWAILAGGTTIATTTAAITWPDLAGSVYIGQSGAADGYFDGWLDEFRICKGIARWTAEFTPPPAAYLHDDYKSGYAGQAVIVFPTRPKLIKQVNADIDSSSRSAADAGHNHAGSYSYLTWYFDTATNNTPGDPTGSGNLVDEATGGSSALWFNAGFGYRVTCDDSSPPSPGGTPIRYKICVAVGSNSIATISYNSIFRVNFGSPSHIFRLDFADLTAGAGTVFQSGWYTCSGSENSWAELGALDAVCYWETGSGQLRINEVYIYVEYYTSAPDGYAAVSLGGTSFLVGNTVAETVIGRRVAVDVQGWVDDASGTITGTPNALIERPDHILKYILLDRCGLSNVIHAASYAAAGSLYNSNSFSLGVPILQPPNVRSLINRVAHQAHSIELWEAGEHHLIALEPEVVDSYTKLLLHMAGSDGSTTFTDDGDTGHTVSANGDAQIDSTQKKFGSGAGLFDGTGDYLSLADHADWDFGANEFTIDFWVRFSSLASAPAFYYQYVDAYHFTGFYGSVAGGELTELAFCHRESVPDSYTKLLLHMDGADESTTFTDDGDTGHTITANGDAQIDTAQQKFGGSAGLFDGTGDYLSIPDHADWAFGSSAFTVDFWVRFSALSNDQPIFIQYTDANNYIYFLANESFGSITYFVLVQYVAGVEEISVSLDVPNLTTNTWYHIALIRGWGGNVNTYALTVNGQMVDTVSDSTAHADVAASLFIGYDPLFSNYLSGWIDEFRISKGVARWTTNFTVPTKPYGMVLVEKILSSPLVTDTWYHIALIRGWGGDGDTYALCIDGTAVYTTADAQELSSLAGSVYIGDDGAGGAYLNGWLDEYRISNGIARWTANFTPPALPYPDVKYTADRILDANRIDLNQIWIKYTGRYSIANSLTARYARDWSGYEDIVESDRAVVANEDADSIVKYGTLTGGQHAYPYILGDSQAQITLQRELDERADVRLIIEFAGGYYLADLERGDTVSFDFEEGDALDQALLGLVSTSDLFRIIDKIDRPDASIQLEVVQMV